VGKYHTDCNQSHTKTSK